MLSKVFFTSSSTNKKFSVYGSTQKVLHHTSQDGGVWKMHYFSEMQADQDCAFIGDLKLASVSSDGSVVVCSVPVTLLQHRIAMKSKSKQIVFRMQDVTCAVTAGGNTGLSAQNEKSGRICTVTFNSSQYYVTEKEVPSSISLPSLGIYAIDSIQPYEDNEIKRDAEGDTEIKINHKFKSPILLYGGSCGLIRMHSL